MQCSELSTFNAVAHKTMKSYLKVNNVQKVAVKVTFDKSSKPKSCKHEVHDIVDTDKNIAVHGEHHKMEEIGYQVDANLQMNNVQELLESGTCEKLREDNNHSAAYITSQNYSRTDLENFQCMAENICGTDAIHGKEGSIEHQRGEEEIENYSVTNDGVTSELLPGILIDYEEQNSLTVNSDWANCTKELDHPSSEQPELIKNFTCEANQVFYGGNHSLKTRGCECLKDTTGKMEVDDLKAPDNSGTDWIIVDFPFQHEQAEQENEAATAAGKLSSRSNFVDAQLHAQNEISYVANGNSNISTSSGEHLELQNLCFAVEQNFQCNHELVYEKSQGKEVNEGVHCVVPEINEVSKSESNGSDVTFTQLEGQIQNEEFDTNKIAEQSPLDPLEAQFGFVEIDSSVENLECSVDTHFRQDVGLIDNAISSEVGTSFLSQESGSLVQSAQASLNECNVQNIGVHGLTNDAVMEGAENKSCLESPGKTRAVEHSQNYYLDKIGEAFPIVRVYNGHEVDSPQHLCQFHTVERTHEDADGVDKSNSESHAKDGQQQLLDDNAFIKDSCWHASTVTGQCSNLIDCVEQFGEDPNLPSLCIAVDQDFDDNHHSFPQHINNVGEFQQDCVLESVTDVLPKRSYACGSDFKSCFNLEKIDNGPSEEDAQSGSVGMESSADRLEHFTERQIWQDMERSGQAISLDSDSAVKMNKYWSEGVTATGAESCSLSEELAVKGVRTSSRSSQVGIGDGSKITFLNETETKIARDGNSPVDKLHNELDDAKVSVKDKDETASV